MIYALEGARQTSELLTLYSYIERPMYESTRRVNAWFYLHSDQKPFSSLVIVQHAYAEVHLIGDFLRIRQLSEAVYKYILPDSQTLPWCGN